MPNKFALLKKILQPKSRRGNLSIFLEFIITITAVTASAIAYYEYKQSKERETLLRLLEFTKEFHTGELVGHQNQIRQFWSRTNSAVILKNEGLEGLQERVDDFLNSEKNSEEAAKHINALVGIISFVDVVFVCVENKVCDSEKYYNFFDDISLNLGCIYGPFLFEYRARTNISDIGRSLEHSIIRNGGCSAND